MITEFGRNLIVLRIVAVFRPNRFCPAHEREQTGNDRSREVRKIELMKLFHCRPKEWVVEPGPGALQVLADSRERLVVG